MSQIDEEEENKVDHSKAYTYIKNEQIPKDITSKFEAHENEGLCISYSRCGSLLLTAGGTQLKTWREDYGGNYLFQ